MTFFSLVADFVGLDPRIASWLIDPSEAAPSFEDLVAKYLGSAVTAETSSTRGNASGDVVSGFGVRCVGTAARHTPPGSERGVVGICFGSFSADVFTFHPVISGRMWVRAGISVSGEAVPEEFCSPPGPSKWTWGSDSPSP